MISQNKVEKVKELLSIYSPSELDSKILRPCPYFEEKERKFTSVYASIHKFAQARLLSLLQRKIGDIQVQGETKIDNGGRIDGLISKFDISVNGKKVAVATGYDKNQEIAVLEIKTGRISLLQPAVYSCQYGLPVIMVELQTGDVHLVDMMVAEKLLSEAIDHWRELEELEEIGRKIPDQNQCRDCRVEDCKHQKTRRVKNKKNIIRRKSRVFDNIDEAVVNIISIIEEILGKKSGKIASIKKAE